MVHSVTLMAQDDYSPPGISYFNLHVTLTDVNDKPESVTIDGSTIPEEVEPGKHALVHHSIYKHADVQGTSC